MSRGGRHRGLLLASLGVAGVAGYFAGVWFDLPTLRLAAKPVPAVVLALWAGRRGHDLTARGVGAGLLLSALGDVLLELGRFVPGLLAFLAAHVSYTAAFVAARPRLLPLRAAPFLLFGAGVLLALRHGLGTMAPPVALYVTVIGTMMWRAAARVGDPADPSTAPWLGLAGALCFAASDTLIAFDRFDGAIPGAALPIMVLYWLGQCGIAASCARGYGMLRSQVSTR